MPWTNGPTRTSTAKWKAQRRRILTRDEHTCTNCGAPATTVDHITPTTLGGTDHDTNLRALCSPCHQAKTNTEASAARHKHKQARSPEPHPGMRAH